MVLLSPHLYIMGLANQFITNQLSSTIIMGSGRVCSSIMGVEDSRYSAMTALVSLVGNL